MTLLQCLVALTCRHLRRYLLPYGPTSRIDIHTTDRYSHITLHPELAVYATRPLAPGVILHELQGSVAPLPEEWRIEMDLSDDFYAAQAVGEESDDEEDVGAASSTAGGSALATKAKGKQKAVEPDRGARRSGRTRRRDFSIIWSELKRCYQLFLGPARFLNVSDSVLLEMGLTCSMTVHQTSNCLVRADTLLFAFCATYASAMSSRLSSE